VPANYDTPEGNLTVLGGGPAIGSDRLHRHHLFPRSFLHRKDLACPMQETERSVSTSLRHTNGEKKKFKPAAKMRSTEPCPIDKAD